MLNVHLIERHIRRAQWDQLVAAVSENGAMIPLSLRARLARVSSRPATGKLNQSNSHVPAGAVDARSGALWTAHGHRSPKDPGERPAVRSQRDCTGNVSKTRSGSNAGGSWRSWESKDSGGAEGSGGYVGNAGDDSGGSGGALALALHRLVELTYGPTSLSREITSRLLEEQDASGSFGEEVATTAAAVSALGRVAAEHASLDASERQRIVAAREHALAFLAASQADDGLFTTNDDRTQQDRALTAAFVLACLAENDAFRTAVRFADLMNWFESHQNELEPATDRLWQLALAGAPAHGPNTPVLAAIAA